MSNLGFFLGTCRSGVKNVVTESVGSTLNERVRSMDRSLPFAFSLTLIPAAILEFMKAANAKLENGRQGSLTHTVSNHHISNISV